MKRIVVVPFSGPLGYQLGRHFAENEVFIDGVDQFMPHGFRSAPLGSARCQSWFDRQRPGGTHYELNLAHRDSVMEMIREIRPSAIIHAPQPFAGDDLVLAGTRHLLEAAREFCWESAFIFLSGNKPT